MSSLAKIMFACIALAAMRTHAADALTIQITPLKKQFCLGEPILVQCELTNGTDAPLDITTAWCLADSSWKFEIVNGKGKLRDTWVFRGLSMRGGKTVIPAHGKVTRTLAVNQWLIPEAGDHELLGGFKDDFDSGSSASARFSVSIAKVSNLKLENTLEALVDGFEEVSYRNVPFDKALFDKVQLSSSYHTELKLGLIYAARYSEATKSSLEKILKSGSKEREILDSIRVVLDGVPKTNQY